MWNASTNGSHTEEAMVNSSINLSFDIGGSYFDFWDRAGDLEKAKEIQSVAYSMYKIYIWIICAIGIPGNVLTVITIYTMKTNSSASICIALLAICDGSALVSKLVAHQLYLHRVPIGPTGCKFTDFFAIYFATTANWMLVLICFHRFISVVYPLKKANIITKKRSYIAALVLMITFLVPYATLFFLMWTWNDEQWCTVKVEFRFFWVKIWYWIQACLFLFIPFLCSAILTGCILRGLYLSGRYLRSLKTDNSSRRSEHQSGTVTNNASGGITRLERMMTIMVIVAAAAFLLLSLPACVYYLADRTTTDRVEEAKWGLFGQIQYLLVDSSHAINFLLYFFTAKGFRDELFKLVTCQRRNNLTARTKSTMKQFTHIGSSSHGCFKLSS